MSRNLTADSGRGAVPRLIENGNEPNTDDAVLPSLFCGPRRGCQAVEKKMGIVALKAMAKQPWPRGADRSAHPNCWYEPMTEPEEAMMGLRFTLSHPVTTAVMPADEASFKPALKLAAKFSPFTPEEVEAMKQKGLAAVPLFRYRDNG